MVGLTLSAEQIRAAPPEVRRWLEQEIAGTLGFEPPAHAMRPPELHLVGASLEEARALLAAIQGLLPVVAVFFELGREAAATPSPGVRAFRMTDILRHTRLSAPEQVLAALEVINDMLRRLRNDTEAVLAAADGRGVCFVAEVTAQNVLRLWQEIVAERALSAPAAAPTPVPAASAEAPIRGAGYSVTMPGGDAGVFRGTRAGLSRRGWSGRGESNPHSQLGRLVHCHYATPAWPEMDFSWRSLVGQSAPG